jgi:hypothetical protein
VVGAVRETLRVTPAAVATLVVGTLAGLGTAIRAGDVVTAAALLKMLAVEMGTRVASVAATPEVAAAEDVETATTSQERIPVAGAVMGAVVTRVAAAATAATTTRTRANREDAAGEVVPTGRTTARSWQD